MAEDSGISWTHNTQNFWNRPVQGRVIADFGKVARALPNTWEDPWKWEAECMVNHYAKRIFTCSYSDFFHAKADPWRNQAWRIIKRTPHLVWLVLTKRPCLASTGNGESVLSLR